MLEALVSTFLYCSLKYDERCFRYLQSPVLHHISFIYPVRRTAPSSCATNISYNSLHFFPHILCFQRLPKNENTVFSYLSLHILSIAICLKHRLIWSTMWVKWRPFRKCRHFGWMACGQKFRSIPTLAGSLFDCISVSIPGARPEHRMLGDNKLAF